MTTRSPNAEVAEQLKRERANAALTTARLAYRRGQLDEAYRHCREVLLIHGDDGEAHELMGEVLRDQHKLDAALEEFRHALELDPTLTNAEEKIGLISIERENLQRAEARRNEFIGDATKRQLEERNPRIAVTVAILIPGGGQWYNEDVPRAAIVFSAVIASLLFWLLPTISAFNEIKLLRPDLIRRGLFPGPGLVLNHLQSQGFVFWWVVLNVLVCCGAWLYGVIEAALTAQRETKFLRRQWGIE